MEYGIEINNKYAMFLDDDECEDPHDVIQRNEEAAAKQKKLDKENAAKNVGKGGAKTAATKNGKPTGKVQSSTTAVEQVKNKTNQDIPKKETVGGEL